MLNYQRVCHIKYAHLLPSFSSLAAAPSFEVQIHHGAHEQRRGASQIPTAGRGGIAAAAAHAPQQGPAAGDLFKGGIGSVGGDSGKILGTYL